VLRHQQHQKPEGDLVLNNEGALGGDDNGTHQPTLGEMPEPLLGLHTNHPYHHLKLITNSVYPPPRPSLQEPPSSWRRINLVGLNCGDER